MKRNLLLKLALMSVIALCLSILPSPALAGGSHGFGGPGQGGLQRPWAKCKKGKCSKKARKHRQRMLMMAAAGGSGQNQDQMMFMLMVLAMSQSNNSSSPYSVASGPGFRAVSGPGFSAVRTPGFTAVKTPDYSALSTPFGRNFAVNRPIY